MCSGPHAFIPGPGVAKFILEFQQGADIAENTLWVHHKDGSAWTAAQLTTMATLIATTYESDFNPIVSNTTTLLQVVAADWSTQTGATVTVSALAGGTSTIQPLPYGVTLAFKMVTGLRGRSFRGRVYQTGLTDIRPSADVLNNAYATQLLTAWNAVLAAINGVTNCELVVFSQCHNGSWRATGVSTPVVTFQLTDFNLDYQRRRATAHSVHH